jgi:hypothetical protein
VLLSARAQDDARDLADSGRFDDARRTLHDAAGRLRTASTGSPRAEDLELEAKRLEERGDEIAGGGYDLMSRKHMSYENRLRKQRRSRPGS